MKESNATEYVFKHINELMKQIPATIKNKYPKGFIAIPDNSELKTIDDSQLIVVVDPETNTSLSEYVLCRDWSLRRRENAPKLDKTNACAVVYMCSLKGAY